MFDILSAMLDQEVFPTEYREALEPPCSLEEKQILALLSQLDGHTAWCLRDSITNMARERHDEGFLSGVRLGARLMLQLLED